MDKGFRKFKRKVRNSAIVRALLSGLSLGVIVVAAQWLIAKLTQAEPDFARYGLIGGAIALVSIAVMLLITLPTDKRLAKRLDEKLGLDEKVQTMIAFRKDDSDMIQLQRMDTDQILLNTPGKKVRSKTAWMAAILPVLACACMVVTVLVPVHADPPDPVDNSSWLLNIYDEQKLKDLIVYVRTSNMQEAPKQEITLELEALLTKLKSTSKKVDMEKAVVDSIANIHQYALVCDTYSNIVSALKNVPTESAETLGKVVGTLHDDKIMQHFDGLLTTLNVEGKGQMAAAMAAGIQQGITNSGEDTANPIVACLDAFAQSLATVTDATTEAELKTMLEAQKTALILAVEQPGIDRDVEKYTINRLMTIFGIPATSIDPEILAAFESEEVSGNPSGSEGENENESNNGGGGGDGQLVFGSDDTIYDPMLEEYVPFGQVLSQYQGIITEYITEGSMSNDIEDMVTDYFAILFRKTEEE